jgi:hypothetical protein
MLVNKWGAQGEFENPIGVSMREVLPFSFPGWAQLLYIGVHSVRLGLKETGTFPREGCLGGEQAFSASSQSLLSSITRAGTQHFCDGQILGFLHK